MIQTIKNLFRGRSFHTYLSDMYFQTQLDLQDAYMNMERAQAEMMMLEKRLQRLDKQIKECGLVSDQSHINIAVEEQVK